MCVMDPKLLFSNSCAAVLTPFINMFVFAPVNWDTALFINKFSFYMVLYFWIFCYVLDLFIYSNHTVLIVEDLKFSGT